jgi:uncharacterized membrane protein
LLFIPPFEKILLRGVGCIMKGILAIDMITIYFGFSLLALGILKSFGVVVLSNSYFFGLAASGLCFTLIDLETVSIRNKKKNKIDNKRISIFYMLAIFFVLVFPNLTFVKYLANDILTSAGETLSLLALGLVIAIVGIRNRLELVEFLESGLNSYKDMEKMQSRQMELLDKMEKLADYLEEEKREIEKFKTEELNNTYKQPN